MWLETPVFAQDLENFCGAAFIPWEKLRRKTIFVTGATGLIGYTLVSGLLYASRKRGLDIKVLALVRSLPKAQEKYAAQLADGNDLQFVVGSVEQLPPIAGPIDYIVHGASQTASRAFVEQPVETINTAVNGTQNILEIARQKQVQGMVYLSSMEVYGHPEKGHLVTENEVGAFSTTNTRNCYPLGKIMCEAMCNAFATEHELPVVIARLTQTFGPGVAKDDQRVFGEFARCIIEHKNIVLKSKGETERCYLYTMDAATAIVQLLLCGKSAKAYSIANETTYCSISQMAELVARMGNVSVQYDLQDVEKLGYASTLYMKLDTSELRALGWQATVSLEEMYKRMLKAM